MHFSNTYFLQNRTHYLDPGLRLRYISHNVKHFPRDCCQLREFVKLPSSWPWRVGRGPPTSGSWLHFRGCRGCRGDRRRPPETAGWIPNRAFYVCFCSKNCSDLTIVQWFFDFFIPLSSKTPSFESFFGRLPARKALKSRCFSWEGYEKVKHITR